MYKYIKYCLKTHDCNKFFQHEKFGLKAIYPILMYTPIRLGADQHESLAIQNINHFEIN